jgi:DNA-binding CsgD family transcriptional regulator
VTGVNLTPRQRDLLGLLLRGHSVKTAAASMGIARQTAINSLVQARQRTGYMSTYQLCVALATEILAGGALTP